MRRFSRAVCLVAALAIILGTAAGCAKRRPVPGPGAPVAERINVLEDPSRSDDVRLETAYSFAHEGTSTALALSAAVHRSDDTVTKLLLFEALASMKSVDTRAIFRGYLTDRDVAGAAAYLLAERGDDSGEQVLADIASGKRTDSGIARSQAADGLRLIREGRRNQSSALQVVAEIRDRVKPTGMTGLSVFAVETVQSQVIELREVRRPESVVETVAGTTPSLSAAGLYFLRSDGVYLLPNGVHVPTRVAAIPTASATILSASPSGSRLILADGSGYWLVDASRGTVRAFGTGLPSLSGFEYDPYASWATDDLVVVAHGDGGSVEVAVEDGSPVLGRWIDLGFASENASGSVVAGYPSATSSVTPILVIQSIRGRRRLASWGSQTENWTPSSIAWVTADSCVVGLDGAAGHRVLLLRLPRLYR